MNLQHDILPLKNQMYRLALRLTLSSQEAEDVVQDVIIRLWQRRESLDAVENIEAYAMRMTRNLAIDRSRMHINQADTLDDALHEEVTAASTEERYEQKEKLDQVKKIMQQLPEKQRTAMHLRDFEGYSYQEIASIMQITEDQVKVNIYRARQTVREFIIHNS